MIEFPILINARTIISILLVGVIFYLQTKNKSLDKRHLQKIVLTSFAGILALIGLEAHLLYSNWSEGSITQFLLPPHEPISYFLGRFLRFSFWPWIAAAFGGAVIAWLSHKLNAKFDERFFEEEEIPLFALGAFLSGYPGILLYAVTILLLELFLTIIYSIAGWGRAPMYYLWLPSALFVIIVVYLLPSHIIGLFSF